MTWYITYCPIYLWVLSVLLCAWRVGIFNNKLLKLIQLLRTFSFCNPTFLFFTSTANATLHKLSVFLRYEESENETTIIGVYNDIFLNKTVQCDFSDRVLLASNFRFTHESWFLHAVSFNIIYNSAGTPNFMFYSTCWSSIASSTFSYLASCW